MRVLVGVVGVIPVDQHASLGHDEQHREVDSVHPASGEKMLALHAKGSLTRELHGCFVCCSYSIVWIQAVRCVRLVDASNSNGRVRSMMG